MIVENLSNSLSDDASDVQELIQVIINIEFNYFLRIVFDDELKFIVTNRNEKMKQVQNTS